MALLPPTAGYLFRYSPRRAEESTNEKLSRCFGDDVAEVCVLAGGLRVTYLTNDAQWGILVCEVGPECCEDGPFATKTVLEPKLPYHYDYAYSYGYAYDCDDYGYDYACDYCYYYWVTPPTQSAGHGDVRNHGSCILVNFWFSSCIPMTLAWARRRGQRVTQ